MLNTRRRWCAVTEVLRGWDADKDTRMNGNGLGEKGDRDAAGVGTTLCGGKRNKDEGYCRRQLSTGIVRRQTKQPTC